MVHIIKLIFSVADRYSKIYPLKLNCTVLELYEKNNFELIGYPNYRGYVINLSGFCYYRHRYPVVTRLYYYFQLIL